MVALPVSDLDEVLAATEGLWDQMRGERVFLSGGTGFFGCWLVESFLHVNRNLRLGAALTVLSRDPEAFLRKMPHLGPELTLVRGDVRDFEFPAGTYRFVIHAATEASAKQLAENPEEMHSTIVQGTARMLEFARQAGTRKLLLTSSGAVYGTQPPDVTRMEEDYAGAAGLTVYGEGKRAAERMCLNSGMNVTIARGFAFVGPHLPLDAHFAVGNFLADALAGRNIRIASDGSSMRSYLYASDLAAWLWTMVFRGESGRAYNVGSEEEVSIRELAWAVRRVVNPKIAVEIAQVPDASRPAHRYVPSTGRACQELGLRQSVNLDEGLRRTAEWQRAVLSGAGMRFNGLLSPGPESM
jgi:dTDP-glucose 4,6-dehydratase